MNFLFGIVVGVLLAIGIAYVHDSSLPSGVSTEARAIVNWQVFDESVRALREDVAEGWSRLTGQPRPRDTNRANERSDLGEARL